MVISRQKNGTVHTHAIRFIVGTVPIFCENCILVVYRLASHAISCYGARSFNLLAPNPSGAATLRRAKSLANKYGFWLAHHGPEPLDYARDKLVEGPYKPL